MPYCPPAGGRFHSERKDGNRLMNDEFRNDRENGFDDETASDRRYDDRNDRDGRAGQDADEDEIRDEELHDDTYDPDDPEPRREEPRREDPGPSAGNGRNGRARGGAGKGSGASRKAPKKERVRLNMNAASGGRKGGDAALKASGFHNAMPYVLLGVGAFLAICLLLNLMCNFGNKLEPNPGSHWMGHMGYGICYGLLGLFGPAALFLPVLFFYLSFFWKRFRSSRNLAPKILNTVVFLFLVAILFHTAYLAMFLKDPEARKLGGWTLMNKGAAMRGGGLLGGKIAYGFLSVLSWAGSFIAELILLTASFFYMIGMTPRYLMMRLRHRRELSARGHATLSEQEAELAKKRAKQAAEAKKAQSSKVEVTPDGYPAGAVMVFDTNGKPLADDVRDLPPLPNIERTADDTLYLPTGVRRVMKEEDEQKRREAEQKAEKERAERERARQEQLEREREARRMAQEELREPEPMPERAPARPSIAPPERRAHYRDVDPIFPQTDNRSAKRVQKEDRNFDLNSIFIDIDDGMVRKPDTAHAPLPPEAPLNAEQQAYAPAQPAPEDAPMPAGTERPDPAPMPAPAPAPVRVAPQPPQPYVFPPLDMLHLGEPMSEENRSEIERNMQQLATTLEDFRISVKNIDYSCGPTVTRYEITPAAGVHARSIMNLSSDIALAFAVESVRMAQIPGKSAIGVEVPNKTRHTVYLRNLLESEQFKKGKTKLTVALGADVVNQPVVFNLPDMPHLLVGGATKMGKSVCINCTIMSLLYQARADEVKLILIDPKKVEFTPYKSIPHLLAPIVTSANDAAGALQAAVEEMESRFELIGEVGVRTMEAYNDTTRDDPDKPFLPYIVIIIDELADLMMQARDQVEPSICRLLQKGRAAGMHLILGTQRPSVDVVTGLIKSNVPSRIACTVASQVDSRTILDMVGAEKLLGRGDMLYAPVGSMRPERVQGAFVSDKEVENICTFIRAKNGNAVYDEKFTRKMKEFSAQVAGKNNKGEEVAVSDDVKDDPKYLDAVRVAVEEGRMSTSLLQRKIEVGYGRAAKLIDRMQAEGIVSPPDGSKPRSVLITKEDYLERFVDGDFAPSDSDGEE